MERRVFDGKKTDGSRLYRSMYSEKVKQEMWQVKKPFTIFGPKLDSGREKFAKDVRNNRREISSLGNNSLLSQKFLNAAKGRARAHFSDFKDSSLPTLKFSPVKKNPTTKSGGDQSPKKCAQKFVDSISGSTQNLIGSGMVPVFKYKKNYAKVPKYLTRLAKQLSTNSNHYDGCETLGAMPEVLKHDEKEEIIRGLQQNWEMVNREYQTLSVIIDTPAKRRKKHQLEQSLDSLENDMMLLSRSKRLIVA